MNPSGPTDTATPATESHGMSASARTWNPLAHLTAARWRDRLYTRYYRRPNHPAKLRIERLLRRLLQLDDIVAPSIDGVQFLLAHADIVQEQMLRTGSWEPRSLALMRRHLRPGDVMVDVGANIGLYALHAAQMVGTEGRAVAIEANPRTYQRLLGNIALNEFSNVVPVLGAVGAVDAAVPMILPSERNSGASRLSVSEGDAPFYVAALSLPALLRQLNISSIAVMKIDVEGMEGAVLRSLDLQSPGSVRPRVILIEYIPSLLERAGESATAVLATLKSAGYELTDIDGRDVPLEGNLAEDNIVAVDASARA